MGRNEIQIIAHRVNSSDSLQKVEEHFGVEIDLRTKNGEIILAHDPFVDGESLAKFMANYSHKMLILNVKEDGLEEQILETLTQFNSPDYFFLDQSLPTLVKSLRIGYNCSMRISEHESPLELLPLQPKWLWIDSFYGNWEHMDSAIKYAKVHQIKTCLVSPELQGRDPQPEIEKLLLRYSENLDAVCTKFPSLWRT